MRIRIEDSRIEVGAGVSLAAWTAIVEDGPTTANDRATFLLVHGLASNARLWDMTALELAKMGHRVSAVDLRGHGMSDKPDYGYDFETLVSDIAKVTEALGLHGPILAGQSLGANLVLETAFVHPDLSRGVVCVDGGTIELSRAFPEWEDAARVLAPPPLIGTEASALRAMLRQAHADWPESGIDATMANFEIRSDGTIAPWLTRENHMQILRGLWENKPSTRYAHLRVPVLFVLADSSAGPPGKHEAAAIAQQEVPKAEVVWFEGADHDIHAQHPVELAQLMAARATDGFL